MTTSNAQVVTRSMSGASDEPIPDAEPPTNAEPPQEADSDNSVDQPERGRKRKRVVAASKLGETALTPDLELIQNGYYPKFISGQLLDDLWRYTLTRTPSYVHLR